MNRSASAYVRGNNTQLPVLSKPQNLHKVTTTAVLLQRDKTMSKKNHASNSQKKAKFREKSVSLSLMTTFEDSSISRIAEFNSIFEFLEGLLKRYQGSLNLKRNILINYQKIYFQKTERQIIKLDKKYGKRRLNCVHKFFKKSTEIDYKAGEKILDNVQRFYYKNYLETINPIFVNSFSVIGEIFASNNSDIDTILRNLDYMITNQRRGLVVQKFNYFIFIEISLRIEKFCENMFKDMNAKINYLGKQLNKASKPLELKSVMKQLHRSLQVLNLNIEQNSVTLNKNYHNENIKNFKSYYKNRLDYHIINLKIAYLYFHYYFKVGKVDKGLSIIFIALEEKLSFIKPYIDFYDKYFNIKGYLLNVIKGNRAKIDPKTTGKIPDLKLGKENWNYSRIISDIQHYESRFDYVKTTYEYLSKFLEIHEFKDMLNHIGEVALNYGYFVQAEKYLTITHYMIDNFDVPATCKDMIRPENIPLVVLKKMKTERRIKILELNKKIFYLNNQILKALINNQKYEKALVCIINNYFIYKNSLKVIDDSDPSRYPKNDGGKNIILQEVNDYNLEMEEKIIFTKIFRYFKENHVILIENYNVMWKNINSQGFTTKNNLFSYVRDIIVNLEKSILYDYRAYHSFIENCEIGNKVSIDICDNEVSYFPLYIGDFSEKIYEKFVADKVLTIINLKKRKNGKKFRITEARKLKKLTETQEVVQANPLDVIVKDSKIKPEDALIFFDIKTDTKLLTDIMFRVNLLHRYETQIKNVEKDFKTNFDFVMSHFEKASQKDLNSIFTIFKSSITKTIENKKKKNKTEKRTSYKNYFEFRMAYHAQRTQHKAQQIDTIKDANRRIFGATNKKSIFAAGYIKDLKEITRNYNLKQELNYDPKPIFKKSKSVEKAYKTPMMFFDRYGIVKSQYVLKVLKKAQKTINTADRRNHRRNNIMNIETLMTMKNAIKNNTVQTKLKNLLNDIRGQEELKYVDMIYSKHLVSKMKFDFSNDMLLEKQNCRLRFTIDESHVFLHMIFVNSRFLLNEDNLCLKFNILKDNNLHDYALISHKLRYFTIIPIIHGLIIHTTLKNFFSHKDLKKFKTNKFLDDFLKKMGLVFPLLFIEFEKFTYEHLKNLSMGLYSNLDLNYLQSFFYIMRFLSFYTYKSLYRGRFGVLNTRDFNLLDFRDNIYFDVSMTDNFILNREIQETVYLYKKIFKNDIKKNFSRRSESSESYKAIKLRLKRYNIIKICLQNLINSMKIYKLFHSSRLKRQDAVNAIIFNQIIKIRKKFFNFIIELKISDSILINYKSFFEKFMKSTIDELRVLNCPEIVEIVEMLILVILLDKTIHVKFIIDKIDESCLYDRTVEKKSHTHSFHQPVSKLLNSIMNQPDEGSSMSFLTLVNFYFKEVNHSNFLSHRVDNDDSFNYILANVNKINSFIMAIYLDPIHNIRVHKGLCSLVDKVSTKDYFATIKNNNAEEFMYFNTKKMIKNYTPNRDLVPGMISRLKAKLKIEQPELIDQVFRILDSIDKLFVSDLSTIKFSELDNTRNNIEFKLEKEFKSKILLRANDFVPRSNNFLNGEDAAANSKKNNMFKAKFNIIAKNMLYGIKKESTKKLLGNNLKISTIKMPYPHKHYCGLSERPNINELREINRRLAQFSNYFISNTSIDKLNTFEKLFYRTRGRIGQTIYSITCIIHFSLSERDSTNCEYYVIDKIDIKVKELKYHQTKITFFGVIRQELILYVLNIISQPKDIVIDCFYELIKLLKRYDQINKNYYYSIIEENVLLAINLSDKPKICSIETSSRKKSKIINNILPNFKIGAPSKHKIQNQNASSNVHIDTSRHLLTRHMVLNYRYLVKNTIQHYLMTFNVKSKKKLTCCVCLDIFIPKHETLVLFSNLMIKEHTMDNSRFNRDNNLNDSLDIFKYYLYMKCCTFFQMRHSGLDIEKTINILDIASYFTFNVSLPQYKFKTHRIVLNNNDITHFIVKNYDHFKTYLKFHYAIDVEATAFSFSHVELFNMIVNYISYNFDFKPSYIYRKLYLKSNHKVHRKGYISNCRINYEIDSSNDNKRFLTNHSLHVKTLSKAVVRHKNIYMIVSLIHNSINDFYSVHVYIPVHRRRFYAKISSSFCKPFIYGTFINICKDVCANKANFFKYKEKRINMFKATNMVSFGANSISNTLGSSINSDSFKTLQMSSFIDTITDPSDMQNIIPTDNEFHATTNVMLQELQDTLNELANIKHKSSLMREFLNYLLENSSNSIKEHFYNFYAKNNYNMARDKIKLLKQIVNHAEVNKLLLKNIVKKINFTKIIAYPHSFRTSSENVKVVFKELILSDLNYTRKSTVYHMNIYLIKVNKEKRDEKEVDLKANLNGTNDFMEGFKQISYFDTLNYNLGVNLFTKKKNVEDKVIFYSKNINLKEVINLKKHEKINELEDNIIGKKLDLNYLINLSKFLSEKLVTSNVFFISSIGESDQR